MVLPIKLLAVVMWAAGPVGEPLPVFGRSVTVDPGFAYYRDRSPEIRWMPSRRSHGRSSPFTQPWP